MQAVVVAAQHDDATMGDDDRVGQSGVVHHARRDTGQVLGLRAQRPDFRAQQPQAHLHQPMIEMGKHDIIAARGQGGVEDDRSDVPGVRMGKALGALRPASGEAGRRKTGQVLRTPVGSGQMPSTSTGISAGCSANSRPTRTTFSICSGVRFSSCWVSCSCAASFSSCSRSLRSNLSMRRAGSASCSARVVSRLRAPAQHGLFDLAGDDRADFAQIFADGFDLERGAHEEFQIAFQVADLARGLRCVEAGADEVVDVHLIGLLPVAVHAAVALFHPVWVPRDFVVNQLRAVILQVDAFGGGIGREQDAHRRFLRVGLERRLDRVRADPLAMPP